MKKRYIILIVILVAVIYKIPKKVNKTYDGYMNIGEEYGKEVKIVFEGKIKRNLTMPSEIHGIVSIEDVSEKIFFSHCPISFSQNLKNKFETNYYSCGKYNDENGTYSTHVFISKDFKLILGRISSLDKKYNEIVHFFAPSDNKNDIGKIYEQIVR